MINYSAIVDQCLAHQDDEKAKAMSAYMKQQFQFFGINAPIRKELVKNLKNKYGLTFNSDLWNLVRLLWEDERRECQYIALDILTPFAKKLTRGHVSTLTWMITTKSWWDTVDGIAPALIGEIFRKDVEARTEHVYQWMESSNIWLQRSAIIFQLKYGKDTDWNLLCEAILKNDTSTEFFVRKGQGWALRQYSKYAPDLVSQFVESNPQLSGLTKREAVRLISNQV